MEFALTLRTFCILYFVLTHTLVSTHYNSTALHGSEHVFCFVEQMNMINFSLFSEIHDFKHHTFFCILLSQVFFTHVREGMRQISVYKLYCIFFKLGDFALSSSPFFFHAFALPLPAHLPLFFPTTRTSFHSLSILS